MRPIYLHACPILLKGDSESGRQTSEQVGAQDQGAAIKGDSNAVNTGTQIDANSGIQNVSATAGSTVNITDGGAVASAAQAVNEALAGIANATQGALDLARDTVVTGQNLATDTNQKASQLAQSVIGANTASTKAGLDWKVVALVGLAIVGAVFAIRKSK